LIGVTLILFLLFHKSPGPQQLMMRPAQAALEQIPAASPISAPTTAPAAAPQVDVQESAPPATPAVSSPPEVKTPPTQAISASTPSMPVYFVDIIELSVRDGPFTSAPRIATLNFKDEVELLETSGGWGRVRNAQRNVVGWSYMRYLQPSAAEGTQAASRHQPLVPGDTEPVSSQTPKHM